MVGLKLRSQHGEASASAPMRPDPSDPWPGSGRDVPAVTRQPGPSSSLRICIHNLDEIGWAYGAGARTAAVDHVRAILKFELRGKRPDSVEHLLRRLGEHPVAHDGQRFHLDLSLSPTSELEASARDASFGRGIQAIPNSAWCRRYRADMALAVTLFERLRNEELFLAWQPIRNAACPGRHLYEECLLRFVGEDGAVVSAGESVAALERLGLVRPLDVHVMNRVIDLLEVDHERRVGVNLSALSLAHDSWWGSTINRLVGDPMIARRIYVEITETAQPADLDAMMAFVAQLREAGCPVVLDDFGTGFSGLRLLTMVQPDIVKLDRSFLRGATEQPARRKALAHLCDYLGAVGAVVVAEGVESVADSAIAAEAGARWQQGYHFGMPSFSRAGSADESQGPPSSGQMVRPCSAAEAAEAADQIFDELSVAWGNGAPSSAAEPILLHKHFAIGQSVLAAPALSDDFIRKSATAFPERAPSPVGYWL